MQIQAVDGAIHEAQVGLGPVLDHVEVVLFHSAKSARRYFAIFRDEDVLTDSRAESFGFAVVVNDLLVDLQIHVLDFAEGTLDAVHVIRELVGG